MLNVGDKLKCLMFQLFGVNLFLCNLDGRNYKHSLNCKIVSKVVSQPELASIILRKYTFQPQLYSSSSGKVERAPN